jgi:L-asparaginase
MDPLVVASDFGDVAVPVGGRHPTIHQEIAVAGVGDGKPTPGQSNALRRAMEKGVVVAIASRTGSGRVNGAGQAMIPAADLNAQKARVLLMLALTRTTDPTEVGKMFASYTVGEQ